MKSFFLTLFCSLYFFSCTDPNIIGLDFQSPSDQIIISESDSLLSFDIITESEDSIRSDEATSLILGEVNDPIFGYNVGTFITQLLLEENNIDFKFEQKNVLEVELENVDLLFLDTWHVYDQLKEELRLHSKNVNKYIILHDTETFGMKGETKGYKGIKFAVDEFLVQNSKTWKLHEHYTFCNGLTILRNEKTFL